MKKKIREAQNRLKHTTRRVPLIAYDDHFHCTCSGLGLTGSPVGGDAADVVTAPGFHGDGVQSSWREGGEDALVVSGGDALVLQDGVVVADQDHVMVQITGGVTPVHLNTNTGSVTAVNNAPIL